MLLQSPDLMAAGSGLGTRLPDVNVTKSLAAAAERVTLRGCDGRTILG